MQSALTTITAILNTSIKLADSDCTFTSKLFPAKFGAIFEQKKDNGSQEFLNEDDSDNVDHLPTFSLKDVARHCSHDDCWIVIKDKVYDVTSFLYEHPAGMDVILENAGTDATNAFSGVSHSKDAHSILNEYCIGSLIPSERLYLNNILPSR